MTLLFSLCCFVFDVCLCACLYAICYMLCVCACCALVCFVYHVLHDLVGRYVLLICFICWPVAGELRAGGHLRDRRGEGSCGGVFCFTAADRHTHYTITIILLLYWIALKLYWLLFLSYVYIYIYIYTYIYIYSYV